MAEIRKGGGEKYQQRHVSRGKLLVRDRIEIVDSDAGPGTAGGARIAELLDEALDRGHVPVLQPHPDHAVVASRRLSHRQRVLHGGAQRLLDHHVLAGLAQEPAGRLVHQVPIVVQDPARHPPG